MWDFSTEPEFQAKLDWIKRFVREECEPLDLLFPHHGDPYDVANETSRAILKPLQQRVKDQGLWACHLDPAQGGKGYGQLKLALINELIGRSYWGPTVFGCAAPDTGNAEILARYGTPEQIGRYLQPLLDGDIVSCYSMTEPHAGADPKEFVCRARREDDAWVIDGEKWFSSNARYAAFLLVMAVTDPDAPPHKRMSMFIVPSETPGIEILRNVAVMGDEPGGDTAIHAYIRYDNVRLPLDAMLGKPGEGFKVAQSRLSVARTHLATKAIGKCTRALEMMTERAASRRTQGRRLADHQFVQGAIADSAIELAQFRLLVMHTAWTIDHLGHDAARTGIAMCKVVLPKVYHDIVQRAIQIHGSLGITLELPLAEMWMSIPSSSLADGSTEVHRVTVAKSLLKEATPAPGLFPTEHLPPKRKAARERYAAILSAGG